MTLHKSREVGRPTSRLAGYRLNKKGRSKARVPAMLDLYLDGLDAFGDGRGFNADHEKARLYVEDAVRNATVRRDALEQIAAFAAAGLGRKA